MTGGVLGLAGLAVLIVAAYDLGLPISGGYLAIDALLVAIGFSSARTIRLYSRQPHWCRRYWKSRAAAVYPVLLTAVALTVIYWSLTHPMAMLDGRSLLGALTMTLNFVHIFSDTSFTEIQHLWLISVISQFFLVAPLLVRGARRYIGLEQRTSALIGMAIGVMLCRLGFLATGAAEPATIAINTLTRFDGLLVGAALGVVPMAVVRRQKITNLAAPAFFAMLIIFLLAPGAGTAPLLTVGLLPAIVVLLAAVVIGSELEPATAARPALSHTLNLLILRWLGERAIGIYIWHSLFGIALSIYDDEMIEGGRTWPGFALFMIRLIFALAASAAGYRFLELPIRSALDRAAGPIGLRAPTPRRDQSDTESTGYHETSHHESVFHETEHGATGYGTTAPSAPYGRGPGPADLHPPSILPPFQEPATVDV